MGPIELFFLVASKKADRPLPPMTTQAMTPSNLTPEQLLALAEPVATKSVRFARMAVSSPSAIVEQQRRWRRVSASFAAAAPALLVFVIAGSLMHTNSALVETVWEITAAAILLSGIVIAVADSQGYYLTTLSAEQTPAQWLELTELAERSPQAAAWRDQATKTGRTLHQFDLEIMWAVVETPSSTP